MPQNRNVNVSERGEITPRARPSNFVEKERKLKKECVVLARIVDDLTDIGDNQLAMHVNMVLEGKVRELKGLKPWPETPIDAQLPGFEIY